MLLFRCFLFCLLAFGLPSLVEAQRSFADLGEVKAMVFNDTIMLKAFRTVPSLVTVDRKGVVRPAGKHRIFYSKKFKRLIIGTPDKGLELKEAFRLLGKGPGSLGPNAELRCYQCGCTPVSKATPNGQAKQCDGSCPCLGWIVIVPTRPIEYETLDGRWTNWGGLP
ncbi:hypothetical protein [Lewinella sp. W8]|uniref:hypothetical protein n=1 Tax=Lewinella sp. W8 TaxID=2528208 RepID=UPI0010673870|nr:hypothetical protein [Lewinella sp. W8]MTB52599.1 hypothetical protein [Lewinella sp. W8]